MTVQDHSWVKILVSAVAGMFTGLIADPVRSLVQNRIEARKLRHAIIWDTATLSETAMRVHDGKLESWKFWLGVEIPSFDYYWEKNPDLFYITAKLTLLRVQCQMILRLRDLVRNKQETPDGAMSKLYETFAYMKLLHEMSWRERRRLARSVRTPDGPSHGGGETEGGSSD
ncbi:MAG TPA: hypothetical protein VHX60_02745 [Acidobacteriaceae bacterium]|jgi:hypothetical protein|nr:hypothetical protein [Acidobacteriaceae bacterium]